MPPDRKTGIASKGEPVRKRGKSTRPPRVPNPVPPRPLGDNLNA